MITQSIIFFISLFLSILYIDIWIERIVNKEETIDDSVRSIIAILATISWSLLYYLSIISKIIEE